MSTKNYRDRKRDNRFIIVSKITFIVIFLLVVIFSVWSTTFVWLVNGFAGSGLIDPSGLFGLDKPENAWELGQALAIVDGPLSIIAILLGLIAIIMQGTDLKISLNSLKDQMRLNSYVSLVDHYNKRIDIADYNIRDIDKNILEMDYDESTFVKKEQYKWDEIEEKNVCKSQINILKEEIMCIVDEYDATLRQKMDVKEKEAINKSTQKRESKEQSREKYYSVRNKTAVNYERIQLYFNLIDYYKNKYDEADISEKNEYKEVINKLELVLLNSIHRKTRQEIDSCLT